MAWYANGTTTASNDMGCRSTVYYHHQRELYCKMTLKLNDIKKSTSWIRRIRKCHSSKQLSICSTWRWRYFENLYSPWHDNRSIEASHAIRSEHRITLCQCLLRGIGSLMPLRSIGTIKFHQNFHLKSFFVLPLVVLILVLLHRRRRLFPRVRYFLLLNWFDSQRNEWRTKEIKNRSFYASLLSQIINQSHFRT